MESLSSRLYPTKMIPPIQCSSFVKKRYPRERTFVKLEADRNSFVS